LLSELSKSNTKYKYDAKYWMANTGVIGVKKDEELAYKHCK
ncbi:29846_t:CDS:1, partial [Gigaspora margarita]